MRGGAVDVEMKLEVNSPLLLNVLLVPGASVVWEVELDVAEVVYTMVVVKYEVYTTEVDDDPLPAVVLETWPLLVVVEESKVEVERATVEVELRYVVTVPSLLKVELVSGSGLVVMILEDDTMYVVEE